MKKVRIMIALFLALLMAAMVPLQASASIIRKEYISELKVVQGISKFDQNDHVIKGSAKEDAQSQLREAGYQMVSEPLNGTNNVYLGYKTTTDPTTAITDISAMNMRGGYTMADYDSVAAQLKKDCSLEIQYFMTGIAQYRANYLAGSPAAVYAHKMLNLYQEDDSGKLMGDFFLDDALTDDAVLEILMNAAGHISSMLKQYIAVACVPYGKNADGTEAQNWMQRLSANGPDDSLSDDLYSDKAQVLQEKFKPIQDSLIKYADYVKQYGENATQETLASQLSETDLFEYSECKAMYEILHSYRYGSETLADLILRLDMFDLYPLAKVLSDAEYAMIYITNAVVFVKCVTSDTSMWKDVTDSADSLLAGQNAAVVSVYDGVDRDLLKGNVALTSRAGRDTNIYGADYNWFQGSMLQAALKITLIGIASISVASFLWCSVSKLTGHEGFGYYVNNYFPSRGAVVPRTLPEGYTRIAGGTKNLPGGIWEQTHSYIYSSVGIVFRAALAVLAVVGMVYGIIDLMAQYNPDQTPIPGVMFDTVTSNAGVVSMVRYDALTNLQGVPTDTQYGINGNQWVELYTTTDRAAGDPITTDMFLSSANQAAASYVPVHMFGETASFSITGNEDMHYLFFTRDANAYMASSAFADGYLGIAAGIGLIAGLAVGVFSGIGICRKKKNRIAVPADEKQ